MKIPLIWLKDYIDIKKTPKEIAESFTALGLMLDKNIDDKILDLEHRMDRSDWLSIYGCARDLAAYEGKKLKELEVYENEGWKPTKEQVIEIKVECPDVVYRLNTRIFRGITIKESPKWLKERLEGYGIASINNVVDITNFVMVEQGQPMHAQDLAKFKEKEIVIRKAKKGEKITTLLGQTIELDPECAIFTQAGKPSVLVGIVGTPLTAVDNKTTDIILDAGNYNQTSVRKTSRKLKIQNETVLRCDKFLHPKATEIALARATKLILELAGGEYYQNCDYYPKVTPIKRMKLRYERILKIGGMEIDPVKVKKILTALGYTLLSENERLVDVEVPYFRTDVEVEDDLVADILRINGYHNIPITSINNAPPKDITPSIYKFEDKLRDILVTLGLHEHITNPLTNKLNFGAVDSTRVGETENEKDNKKNDPITKEVASAAINIPPAIEPHTTTQVILENSLASDKSVLRQKISGTLASVVENYHKNKIDDVGVFELGLVYFVDGNVTQFKNYVEERKVCVLLSKVGMDHLATAKKLKHLFATLIANLGIDAKNVTYENAQNPTAIYINKELLGKISASSFELDTKVLEKYAQLPNKQKLQSEIKNTQYIDFSILVSKDQLLGQIHNAILNFSPNILSVEIAETYMNTKLKENSKEVLYKSVLFRIEVAQKEETLITKLTENLKKNFAISTR